MNRQGPERFASLWQISIALKKLLDLNRSIPLKMALKRPLNIIFRQSAKGDNK